MCRRGERNNLSREHAATDLRSALRHTVRAKCKAALLFPPDCDTQWISVNVTGTSWTQKNSVSYRCTCELTGKMKLVSGGSSAVNASIQVSRSVIGPAVNFVLSYKKQNREKNKPKGSWSTRHNISLHHTNWQMHTRVTLSRRWARGGNIGAHVL